VLHWKPNGRRKLRLRPPNLQSREPHRRSRQLDAVLGHTQAPAPPHANATHDGAPCWPPAARPAAKRAEPPTATRVAPADPLRAPRTLCYHAGEPLAAATAHSTGRLLA